MSARWRLDHVTAVVGDADAAAAVFERLLGDPPAVALALPSMTIRSFHVAGTELHLNAPAGPGPVRDHHAAHGASLHHVAFAVGDLDEALADLAPRGFRACGAPVTTAPGVREVFLDPATTEGLLIQLVERTAADARAFDAGAIETLARTTIPNPGETR